MCPGTKERGEKYFSVFRLCSNQFDLPFSMDRYNKYANRQNFELLQLPKVNEHNLEVLRTLDKWMLNK